MKQVWYGVLLAIFLLVAVFYVSSSGVQKMRSDQSIATIQTG
jgi:hypothetical protein